MTAPANSLTINLPLKIDRSEAEFILLATLFGKGRISSGRAAEFLKMSRMDFLKEVGDYGISIFSDDTNNLDVTKYIQL